MKILAIEFSSDHRSVALVENGRALGTASESATRESHAFALIERALAEAKLEREAIECIAVGLGPGSYTGIRMTIALAQGWQLATGVKLLGVSSVECIAAEAQAAAIYGRVNTVVDAQRNELYLAGYEIGKEVRRAVSPLVLASLEEAQRRAAAGEVMAGPEVGRWFPNGRRVVPTAGMLGRLTEGQTDFVEGSKLEPIYLREVSFVKAPLPWVLPGL